MILIYKNKEMLKKILISLAILWTFWNSFAVEMSENNIKKYTQNVSTNFKIIIKNIEKKSFTDWTAPKKVEWLKKHSTFFSFWIY